LRSIILGIGRGCGAGFSMTGSACCFCCKSAR
jgi:hypothetical protein